MCLINKLCILTKILIVGSTFFCFTYCIDIQSENLEDNQHNSSSNHNNKLLSRNRRYLIFPEGSSLQVVFDEIIPIVDYNNFLILGVTVALAWELPSKPPSELIEDLREKINDGTLGLRKDENIETLEYVNKKMKTVPTQSKYTLYNKYDNSVHQKYIPHEEISSKPIKFNYTLSNFYKERTTPVHKTYSYYKHYDPFYIDSIKHGNKFLYSSAIEGNSNPVPWKQTSWPKAGDRISNIKILKNRLINTNSKNRFAGKGQWNHRIYPVFGKRSIKRYQNIEEKVNTKYHRSTRHTVYLKIQKYLELNSNNDADCLLQAICKTGQKKKEIKPSAFIAEIIRAVFSFPLDYEEKDNSKHQFYDEAFAHQGNCKKRYPKCSHNILENHFY